MATGSGKTIAAITAIYRLIKYGGARRVLFLVDRKDLGKQAEREFQGYCGAGLGEHAAGAVDEEHAEVGVAARAEGSGATDAVAGVLSGGRPRKQAKWRPDGKRCTSPAKATRAGVPRRGGHDAPQQCWQPQW
jgi:hypothetical protein